MSRIGDDLQSLADTLDDYNYPIGSKDDCLKAADILNRLEEASFRLSIHNKSLVEHLRKKPELCIPTSEEQEKWLSFKAELYQRISHCKDEIILISQEII